MQKLKIVIAMFSSLIVITIAVRYFFPTPQTMPVPHVALQLVLKQTKDFNLALNSIQFINTYPQDYKLTLFSDYDKIVIRDKKEHILYKGTFLVKNFLLPPPPLPGQDPGKSVEILLEQITLFLPYYKSMQEINFYNENNTLLLSISADKYIVPPTIGFQNLCGNGICDINENILSCFSDCRRK